MPYQIANGLGSARGHALIRAARTIIARPAATQIAAIKMDIMRAGKERFGRQLSTGRKSGSGSFKRSGDFGLVMTKLTSAFFFLELFFRFRAIDSLTPSHKIFRETIS
ncbi:MAG: hypothetical protein IH610_05185 [Deltaproteobacteria bacterium]|nr:hypothetical protein [Deltaproteobacteria bacterium]